ncbi:MAG: sugar phosphate nucleotidyltransferase [Melioribacteraceae bacterium]|nr:hypothetical protein [Melioribacteraceae bacterium]MDD3557849.1 sugar phosphate nucleotidyltransferase [Melioribacteraceae bacterium]
MDGKIMILAAGVSSRMKKPDNTITADEKLIHEADTISKSMIGVGKDNRPFMDYLLFNITEAGYREVLFIINEKDEFIKKYYKLENENDKKLGNLNLSFTVQSIPEGRSKPMGTADAVFQGMMSRPDWSGGKFTVCNSDNLYSVNTLKLLLNSDKKNSMINYDLKGLRFTDDRHKKFAVISVSKNGYLRSIIEKPSEEEIEKLKEEMGYTGISMNIFKFDYDLMFPYFQNTPLTHGRDEKEIPTTINLMIKDHVDGMFTYKVCEHVPDMTSKKDLIETQKYLESEFNLDRPFLG